MATAGEIIDNPVTGERCRWHLTAADTDGALVRAEFWVRPGGQVAGEHVHLRSEERFEVLGGRLILSCDGRERVLLAGERGRVPAGTPHAWRNGGDDELHMMVEIDEPGSFEHVLEAVFAAARAGRVNAEGMPSLLDLALMVREHGTDSYATSPPRWVQRLLLPPLGLVASLVRAPLPVAPETAAA